MHAPCKVFADHFWGWDSGPVCVHCGARADIKFLAKSQATIRSAPEGIAHLEGETVTIVPGGKPIPTSHHSPFPDRAYRFALAKMQEPPDV